MYIFGYLSWQIDRQTDWQIDRQTDRQTDWFIDLNLYTISQFIFINQSVCKSVCLSICLSVYLSAQITKYIHNTYIYIYSQFISLNQSVYLSVCLFICLSVYLSVCLSLSLSVSLCLSLSLCQPSHTSTWPCSTKRPSASKTLPMVDAAVSCIDWWTTETIPPPPKFANSTRTWGEQVQVHACKCCCSPPWQDAEAGYLHAFIPVL